MLDDTFFIERNISHYEAMLKLQVSQQSRGLLMRLLAEAEHKLLVCTSAAAVVDAGRGGWQVAGREAVLF